jgi:serine/threonine protein kinase
VWSSGVVLHAMLCGSLPFDDENIPKLFQKIRSGRYSPPQSLEPPVRDLLKRMLTVAPLARISVPEIWDHPWFTVDLPPYLLALRVRFQPHARTQDCATRATCMRSMRADGACSGAHPR